MPFSSFRSISDPVLSEDQSDAQSTITMAPWSPTLSAGATSLTSNNISERSESPAPSLISFHSSMRELAFTREHGREINNYSQVYRLPADREEHERLSESHLTIRTLLLIFQLSSMPCIG
jgi:hypothetical protein